MRYKPPAGSHRPGGAHPVSVTPAGTALIVAVR